MKKGTLIVGSIMCAVLLLGAAAQQLALPLARLTIKVVDEAGNAVPAANVTLTFKDPMTRKGYSVSGLTDAAGLHSEQGGSDSSIGGQVTKEGYYRAGFPFAPFREVVAGRWQPWDKTYTSVLRKIENPVPMYVRLIAAKTPTTVGEPCGFDLIEGDWVAPHGKGKIADLVVTVTHSRYDSDFDYDGSLAFSFSNSDDGIQETQLPSEFAQSQFKWPRFAPETGYQAKLEARRLLLNPSDGQSKTINTANEEQAYFFRVRTAKQGDKIVSALYGKIKGGIRVGPSRGNRGFMEFIYYLNPVQNDRNMEFDPERNLASDSTNGDQRLRQP